jgi:integrase
MAKRRFGRVRKLPSGRWQARYPGPDGADRPADETFETKTSAEVWLTLKEAEILRGDWIDPKGGEVLVETYAATWIDERDLRPRTIRLYRYLLKAHVVPHFKEINIGDVKSARIRRWRKTLLDAGVSPVTVAKAYRFLRAVFNTAVKDDEIIRRNPCSIKGADKEDSPERPVLSVAQVYLLADAIGSRYRALVLLAAFASLRWAELAALRPEDIDLDGRTVRITRQIDYPPGGGHVFGPPKSRAGRRVVPFPALIELDLRKHLDTLDDSAELVFTSSEGTPLRHSNWYRRVWMPALETVGLTGVHFHDLRHTGNQFAANAGANIRDLMDRMGHDSTRAAMIYLHSSTERQGAIADQIGKDAEAALGKDKGERKSKRSGTQRARGRRDK